MASRITDLLINVRVGSAQAVKGFNDLNFALTAINTTAVLIGKSLSHVASEFEKNMRNVNSIAQVTEDQYKKVQDSVRAFVDDPSIKDGAIKLADGMYQLVSSGFDTKQALDNIAVASKSASAGLTDTKVSVTGLSLLMNSYNQKTLKDAEKYSDDLFRVVDKGVLSFEQLATNLGSVVSIGASTGVTFKEIGAGFIELTRAGISASEAETALAGLIRELSNPNPETLKFAKLLGADKSIGEYAIQTKGLIGVLKELNQVSGESSTILQKIIPEARAVKAALVLSREGATGYTRALEEMNTSLGSTDRALSQQTKSFAFQMEKFKAQLEDLKIEYGLVLNDGLRPMLASTTDFIKVLKDLDPETKNLIIKVGLVTVGIGTLSLGFKALIFLATPIISFFTGISSVAVALTANIASIGLATEGFMTTLAFPAPVVFFTSIAVSVGAVASGIGALIASLMTVNEWLKKNQAEAHAEKDNNELLKQKEQAIKTINDLRLKENQLKKEGKTLDSADLEKMAKASAIMSTFSDSSYGKKRFREEAQEQMKASKEIAIQEEKDAKAKKQSQIEIAKAGEAKIKQAELLAKKQEEAEREAKRRAEEFKRETEQLQNDIVNINKTALDDITRLNSNQLAYKVYQLNQEYQERKNTLDKAKAHHIDITEASKNIDRDYLENLKAIKKEEDELRNKDKDTKSNINTENKNTISDLLFTASNPTARQRLLNDQQKTFNSLKDQFERNKKQMETSKTFDLKDMFSKEEIDKVTKEFYLALGKFKESQKNAITSEDTVKNYEDSIQKIQDAINFISTDETKLRGERISAQIAEQQKILDAATIASKDVKILEEDKRKEFAKTAEESAAKIKGLLTEQEKLVKEGISNLIKLGQGLVNELDLFNTDSMNKILGFTEFTDNGLESIKSLDDALNKLKEGGLKGLTDFAKGGGDMSGITAFAEFAISQSKKIIQSITNNVKKTSSSADFMEMMQNITDDFADAITLGATTGLRKALGLKTFEEIRAENNQILESQAKLSNDKIKLLDTNYQIELDNINKTIKNEELKNLKIKLLDKDLYNSKFEYIQKIQELNYKTMDLTEAEKMTADAVMQLEKMKVEITDINELEKNRLIILKDLANNLQKIQDNYYSDIESLMSKYYDKEVKYIKDSHKLEQANILSRQKQIELNQDKIDSLNDEIDAIQEKYDKLLNNKDLSRSASQKFAGALRTFRSQNGGLDVSELIRTAPTEFERIIASRKEEIENQFNMTGDVSARSKALQELAVQQNVYWKEISLNIVKGTKEYDEAIKKSNDGFRDFKDALKDSLEAQKDFELENKNINGSVVNLKVEIEKLTKENKSYQTEINAYNKTIQTGIDALTNKFKDASGSWITNINQARQALQDLSSDSANAVNALNNIQTNYEKAKSTSNLIVKDTTKPITSSNINTSVSSSQLSSGFSDMRAGESVNDYIARITREDAAKEKARLSSLNVSTTPLIQATADFSNANQKVNTNNNFATGTMTVAPGIFDKGGSFGWINPLNWFANGGVADGPSTGYPALLHNKEVILNEPQADNLMAIYRLANTRPNYSNYANSSSYNQTVIVNGSNLTEKQLTTAIKNVFSDMRQRERTAY